MRGTIAVVFVCSMFFTMFMSLAIKAGIRDAPDWLFVSLVMLAGLFLGLALMNAALIGQFEEPKATPASATGA